MPLIALCVGLILDIPEMLFLQWGKNELLIVSPSLSVIILMSLMLILSGLRTSIDNDTDINWIYDSVPMGSRLQFKRGCLKFVLLYYLFPVFVISGSILSVKISVYEVLINFIYLLSFLLVFTEVLLRIGTALPFSAENLRLDSVTKYTDIFVVLITGTVFFVSQIIIFKNVIFTISAVILFLIIYLFLTGINIRKKSI
jgi:hypothetical protein